jgi:hypothetical protein
MEVSKSLELLEMILRAAALAHLPKADHIAVEQAGQQLRNLLNPEPIVPEVAE